MTPDDPRHGTYAGWQAHERDGETPCESCARAKFVARKQWDVERLRGVRMFYTRDELLEVMQPWLTQGIRPSAIAFAAGFHDQKGSTICELIRENSTRVRRSTYLAISAVTEDAFSERAKVGADLTRRRIYSLMAAGHALIDMPINPRGQWRSRDMLSIGTARAIRDYYQAHEQTTGPHAHTSARALHAGHIVPAGWDDPGTLGWSGPPELDDIGDDQIDEAVVLRLLDGKQMQSTKAEKVEAMRRWLSWGRSEKSLCAIHGWKDGRYVTREAEAA